RGDARRIGRQRDAIGDDAVGAHVLAGYHGGAGRHADHVLIVRAAIVDTAGGEPVGDRSPRYRAAVASERVVALLVGGDKKNVASHGFGSRLENFTLSAGRGSLSPSRRARRFRTAPDAAASAPTRPSWWRHRARRSSRAFHRRRASRVQARTRQSPRPASDRAHA